MVSTIKFVNIRTPKVCCNPLKFKQGDFYHRVMPLKDADKTANSVDPDQTSSLIWVSTVCQDLSAQKLRFHSV